MCVWRYYEEVHLCRVIMKSYEEACLCGGIMKTCVCVGFTKRHVCEEVLSKGMQCHKIVNYVNVEKEYFNAYQFLTTFKYSREVINTCGVVNTSMHNVLCERPVLFTFKKWRFHVL